MLQFQQLVGWPTRQGLINNSPFFRTGPLLFSDWLKVVIAHLLTSALVVSSVSISFDDPYLLTNCRQLFILQRRLRTWKSVDCHSIGIHDDWSPFIAPPGSTPQYVPSEFSTATGLQKAAETSVVCHTWLTSPDHKFKPSVFIVECRFSHRYSDCAMDQYRL
jgi:hypothetical protein